MQSVHIPTTGCAIFQIRVVLAYFEIHQFSDSALVQHVLNNLVVHHRAEPLQDESKVQSQLGASSGASPPMRDPPRNSQAYTHMQSFLCTRPHCILSTHPKSMPKRLESDYVLETPVAMEYNVINT
eukprot:1142863-Amphidinium_carterae.3